MIATRTTTIISSPIFEIIVSLTLDTFHVDILFIAIGANGQFIYYQNRIIEGITIQNPAGLNQEMIRRGAQ